MRVEGSSGVRAYLSGQLSRRHGEDRRGVLLFTEL